MPSILSTVTKRIKKATQERKELKRIEEEAYKKEKAKVEAKRREEKRKQAEERARKRATGELRRERAEKIKKGLITFAEVGAAMGEGMSKSAASRGGKVSLVPTKPAGKASTKKSSGKKSTGKKSGGKKSTATYYCTKCKAKHRKTSKIGKAHIKHKR